MGKHYRSQIGNIKLAVFDNPPKEQGRRGYKSICITKSVKQDNGEWKDEQLYLFPSEFLSLLAMADKLKGAYVEAESFELTQKSEQVGGVEVADDIPF